MKLINFSKSTSLPSLPTEIEGHALEAFKSQHGIILTAPTHPKQATFLLLRGEQPAQVHGPLKRLLLDLATGRATAEEGLNVKKNDFAEWFFGLQPE